MAISAARQKGLCGIVVPDTNAAEAAVVEELKVIPESSLADAAAFNAGHLDIDPVPSRLQGLFHALSHYDDDYSDVRGQESAKRALVIAAAGAHNLLMLDPPGSGEGEYISQHPTVERAAILGRKCDVDATGSLFPGILPEIGVRMPASAEAPRRVGVAGPTTGPNASEGTGILLGSGN